MNDTPSNDNTERITLQFPGFPPIQSVGPAITEQPTPELIAERAAHRPHRFESECPGNDGRCKHSVMWGDRTDVLGRNRVPRCPQCAAGDLAECTCRNLA